MVSAVELAGASRERVLARAGIAAEQLDSGETWLSVTEYIRFLESALEITDDPALGLHFGEQTSSVMFQLLAHLVEHSATLGEALDMIARYTELLAQDFKPSVIVMDERVALRFSFLSGDQPAVRVMCDLAMSGLLRLLRQYVGEAGVPSSVSFPYAKPARVEEYRRMFGGRERFDQPCAELCFPREWLSRTQLHANPELHVLLKSQADRQLALQRSSTTCARIQQLLAASDVRALPSMPSVARTLGMSARTLARKLSGESTTFADLIAKRRQNAAERLLELRVLSVQEVAEAMGFTDASAFHKAFKRWTGLTPMQYVASVSG